MKRPDHRIILASYSPDFASTWGRKGRDLIEEYGPMFGLTVRSDSSAANRWDIANRKGGMFTTGVGGPATGKGANLLVIDDPVKGAVDVQSINYRDDQYTWYTGTIYSRLEPDAAIILIQTRWHDDDLMGRILASDNEQWTVLSFPAIAEDHDVLGRAPGDALWPERFDIPALRRIEKVQGPYWFAAMFQQRPAPAEGNLFKRDGIRYWRDHGEYYQLIQANGDIKNVRKTDCWRFATVDLAASLKETADYTVIGVWACSPNAEIIALDIRRERLAGPDQLPLVQAIYDEYKLGYVAIERVQYQLAFVQSARYAGLPVRELKADKDKVSRAQSAAAKWAAGDVYLYENASWCGIATEEIIAFPNAAHDDIVDTMSYAADEVAKRGSFSEAYGTTRCAACDTMYYNPKGDAPCPKCGMKIAA
jgi:predicted phage terminase large subunit-like protein